VYSGKEVLLIAGKLSVLSNAEGIYIYMRWLRLGNRG
jgi:hypothetical protein